MSPRKARVMDGYVRVSKVNGREDMMSPTTQRKTIERLAKARGVRLGEVVDELDVSGKTSIDKRELGRLVRKVEAGQSDGIIVWKVTRYSRDWKDGIETAMRVLDAGGIVLADDCDTSAPFGRTILSMLLEAAELERDQRRASFEGGASRATERGIHLGPAPTGYNRNGGGKLHLDEDAAPTVREAFRMRIDGKSLQAIADYLTAEGVKPNRAKHWSRSSIKAMLGSRVYRGEAFRRFEDGSEIRVPDAHPAIVEDEATWQLAQAEGKRPEHNGTIAAQGLLLGIVRCAGCGHPMSVTGSGPQDARFATYYCRDPKTRDCKAPASAATAKVDALVEPELLRRLKRSRKPVKAAEDRVSYLIRDMEKAEAELEAFLQYAKPSELKEDYAPLIKRHRDAVAQAREACYEAMNVVEAFDYLPTPDAWPDVPMKERRQIIAGMIESVEVAKSTNGRWQPIAERVQVAWR